MNNSNSGDAYGEGVAVVLRGGRTIYLHALTLLSMKRTREVRQLIYESKVNSDSQEWEDAALEVIHVSATEGGDTVTKDELANLLTRFTINRCFSAMAAAARGERTIPDKEVAEKGTTPPSQSLNGTSSTPTSSPTLDGPGTIVTN